MSNLPWSEKRKESLAIEIKNRLNYFYLKMGAWEFPSSAEGDLLKMVQVYFEPKPGVVPEPPSVTKIPGFRPLYKDECWHCMDWRLAWIPPGWRPLLLGEQIEAGDEVRIEQKGCFVSWTDEEKPGRVTEHSAFHRTTRPLPDIWWDGKADVPMPLCWLLTAKGNASLIIHVATEGVAAMGYPDAVLFTWQDLASLKARYAIDGVSWKPCIKEFDV